MVRRGNLIRVAPLADAREGARAGDRAPEAADRARAARDAPHPGQLRRRPSELQDARQASCSRERGSIVGRRAHQRAHRARRRRQPRPHRGARPHARHADAAGARRGAHRRGDEPLPARRRHPVGRRRACSSAATGNPTGLVFPNDVGVAGGASDGSTPTAGLSPFARRVAEPELRVNLPAAAGTGQGGAIGLSLRLDRRQLQPRRAPLGGRGERSRAHHRRARASSRSTTARRASRRAR